VAGEGQRWLETQPKLQAEFTLRAIYFRQTGGTR